MSELKSSSLFKEFLKNYVRWPLQFLGINPYALIAIRHLPRYFSERSKFRKAGGIIDRSMPLLGEFTAQAGTAKGHYFHQDLLVASLISTAQPERHIDIGSRVDGFVGHVASFREIEVLDVRRLEDSGHEHIKFLQADLMVDDVSQHDIADSVSCLHAIEHFGLGRYGDPIAPRGHLLGFENIVKMVKSGGTLYISFPIGAETRVYFNAYRIFHPREIFTWPGREMLQLVRFDFVDDKGALQKEFPLMERLPVATFGCGIYTFRKAVGATIGA